MKTKRQAKILELIKESICLTQEDLQNGLLKAGYNVTQSTVSRDIRELKLVKGRDEQGNYRYLSNQNLNIKKKESHYRQLFANAAVSISYAINNVVVKCHTGMASSACVAVDEMFGDMMLGSLAGDDTIIIVTDNEEKSMLLADNLTKLL